MTRAVPKRMRRPGIKLAGADRDWLLGTTRPEMHHVASSRDNSKTILGGFFTSCRET